MLEQTSQSARADHPVVSREEWLAARKRLLTREKQLTRTLDAVAAERRHLPWVAVDKRYVFDTPEGQRTLAELFGRNSQLIVYHFMWRFDLDQGCDGCSFLCDHIDGANQHLKHHDVTVIAVSRGPLDKLAGYWSRMGWKFPFASSAGSDFSFDYGASFTDAQRASGRVTYNYESIAAGPPDLPGLSVFYKDEAGRVFHTYSTYARGGDILIGAHNFLDLTPKGRNETAIMDWVKRHDEYEADTASPGCCGT
ncbi:MAG TPA: thioredoxin family protein [Xanthobacteraceae bacterium]|nr:thioredoxin family protein [Xanthobacteraceae bacterium]